MTAQLCAGGNSLIAGAIFRIKRIIDNPAKVPIAWSIKESKTEIMPKFASERSIPPAITAKQGISDDHDITYFTTTQTEGSYILGYTHVVCRVPTLCCATIPAHRFIPLPGICRYLFAYCFHDPVLNISQLGRLCVMMRYWKLISQIGLSF